MPQINVPELQVQQPASLADQFGKVLSIKAAIQQQQQMQTQMQEDAAYKQAIARAGGDIKTALPEIMKVAPRRGLEIQKHLAEWENLDTEGKIKKLDLEGKRVERLGQLAGSAIDQNSWQTAVGQAAQEQLINPQQAQQLISQPFNPQTVQQLQQQALTVKEQIAAAQQKITQTETNRHNVATENKPTAEQADFRDFYKSYLDAKGLPDTAANNFNARKEYQQMKHAPTDVNQYVSDYLSSNNLPNTPANRMKGHQAFTKETKIDPGVARAEIFVNQRPTEVADPNAAGQTVILPAKDAIGMAGKASSSVVTPKAMDKYMTSGKGGQQLTAFNTAIAHLDTLERLAGDLGNGDIQIFNRAAQKWAEETGQPAPASFDAARNAMSGEVAAALKASGATDQEIAKVNGTFSRAQSNAQFKGAIGTYRQLLNSKRDQLKAQFEGGKVVQPNFGDQKKADPLGIR